MQATEKRGGNEHGRQYRGDRNDRAGDLAHRPSRSLHRLLAVLDMPLDVLHHHDGIVDHNADRQHQAKQRQGIEREAHQVHDRKGADDRHRHGHQGNQRRAPVAQEHHHHDHHQQDRFHQRDGHRLQRSAHKHGGVIGNPRHQPFREVGLQALHGVAHRLRHIEGVGPRALDDLQGHRRLAVQQAAQRVGIGAHLDTGHITQARDLAVIAGADDDVAKLLFIRQAPEGIDRDLERRSGIRCLADRAGRHLHVLLAHGGDDIAGGQATGGDQVRVEPQAHAVFTRAPHQHIVDPRQARQLIAHLQVGIVGDVERVITLVGGQQVDHHEDVRRGFLRDHAQALHLFGQARQSPRHTVLHLDLGHVRVGALGEGRGQDHAAIGGRLRGHVKHALNPGDHLFQRRRHRLGNHLRVGPRIRRRHLHRGRRDGGIFAQR